MDINMEYAVIDIGTNTIRSVIYNKAFEVIDEIVSESCILENMIDEQLSERGIITLCKSLKNASGFFRHKGVSNIFCFATSAMRDVKNFENVNKMIKTTCGFETELISEEEEAICDYTSLKMQIGKNCSGAGIDLGGGSCQVMLFEKGELKSHYSRKLGVKRLYKLFGELTQGIESEVREYIRKNLSDSEFSDGEYLYVMGGSSKIIQKSAQNILKTEVITRSSVNDLLGLYYKADSEYGILAGTEYYKLPYGILVIDELCKIIKTEKIKVMNGGVREGYIKRKIDFVS